MFSVALSVGHAFTRPARVYRQQSALAGDAGLRGIAPFGVRTFLPGRRSGPKRFSALPKSTDSIPLAASGHKW